MKFDYLTYLSDFKPMHDQMTELVELLSKQHCPMYDARQFDSFNIYHKDGEFGEGYYIVASNQITDAMGETGPITFFVDGGELIHIKNTFVGNGTKVYDEYIEVLRDPRNQR